ncbi:hypothetical protein D4Q76_01135 [archaeon]|nr:MAG: hypothetical protein D4Q76_01135 [archaeon]
MGSELFSKGEFMLALDVLFKPKSVAVIGASRTQGKIGYAILDSIKRSFSGKIYPINPEASEIMGLTAFPSVSAVPEPIDLAVIAVKAEKVKDIILECKKKKIKAVIIITSGFSEIGNKEGELELKKAGKDIKILGPNCISGSSFALIKNDNHIKHIEIGGFIDNLFEKNKDKAFNVSGTYTLPSNVIEKNIKILSYDGKEYCFKKVVNFFKRKGEAVKVTLEGGREIICSPDHPFLIRTRQKNIKTRLCKDLEIGNLVPIMFGFPSESHGEEINLIQEIDKKVSDEIKSNIVIKNKERISFNEAKNIDEPSKFSVGFKGDQVFLPAVLPITGELCRLIGFFVADGNYDKTYLSIGYTDNREEETEIRRCINSVFKCRVSKDPLNQKIKFGRRIGKLLFEGIFEIGKYAENKSIPNFIFSQSPEIIASFLSGLYSGDGGISINGKKKSATLFYYTTSKKLANQICYIFSLLGIGPVYFNIRKRDFMEFNGKKYPAMDLFDIRTDSKQAISKLFDLGFRFFDPKQNEKLKNVVENRHKFKGRVKDNVYFRKIKNIEKLKEKIDLYDFEVEDSHTFVADQIITHNCVGVFSPKVMDTLFMPHERLKRPGEGGIGFISQSGAFGTALIDLAASEGAGISKFISVGNQVDINETDMIEYLGKDPSTRAIAVYLESITDGKAFVSVAKRVSKIKPIIVLKAGKTKAGAEAAASHTGSLAGETQVYSAAFGQAGIIEAKTTEEIFDYAKVLANQPALKDNKLTIVTDGGGFGILAADAAEECGLELVKLDEKSLSGLMQILPSYASLKNPIDLTGDSTTERYQKSLDIVFKDKNVSGVVVIALLQIATLDEKIIDVLRDCKMYGKPFVVCATGGEYTQERARKLESFGIPVYPTPERAVKAMCALRDYGKIAEAGKPAPKIEEKKVEKKPTKITKKPPAKAAKKKRK